LKIIYCQTRSAVLRRYNFLLFPIRKHLRKSVFQEKIFEDGDLS